MKFSINVPVFIAFILLYLSYAVFFQFNHLTQPFYSFSKCGDVRAENHVRFLLTRLLRGRDLEEVNKNGISCVNRLPSVFCVTTGDVRIKTGARPIVFLSAGQQFANGTTFSIKPYPRQNDEAAMVNTMSIDIVSHVESNNGIPMCDVVHVDPAIVFSTGGYSGNFFHAINDLIMPLFITTSDFKSRIQFVIADYAPYWIKKFSQILSQLSAHDVVVASSSYFPVRSRVHCFPGAIVGFKYHDTLNINSSDAPGDLNIMDFRHFLHQSLSLKNAPITPVAGKKPIMVIIARRKSRSLLNENEVAHLASEVGFDVRLAPPSRLKNVTEFSQLVNSCSVMVGVVGAGLTNLVFLPKDAVVVQIVPLQLNWDARVCYGKNPSEKFGLRYLEYHVRLEESSFYTQYSKDHPVISDPNSIKRQGYPAFKAVYLDGQNVTVDISRFKHTLLQAYKEVVSVNRSMTS